MEAVAVRSETGVSSQTEVLDSQREVATTSKPVLRLRLKNPKNDRKVGWREGTVDNEHMGKKKSKCCCIYKKPVAFGESSSESDEECEHCFGHPEKRRKNAKKHHHDHDHNGDDDCDGDSNSDADDKGPSCDWTPKGDGTQPPKPESEPKPTAAPK